MNDDTSMAAESRMIFKSLIFVLIVFDINQQFDLNHGRINVNNFNGD